MNNCKIYIVDDHRMFSDGLKTIIETQIGLEVQKVFSNAEDLLDVLNFSQPDMIISDITMPKMSGINLAKMVRAKFPSIKFLILSMHNNGNYLKEAIDAGVHGYIPKDSKAEEVFNAIQMILEGNTYISPTISASLIKDNLKIEITPRELDILQNIAWGLNTQQIAEKLFISPHTVETHRKNLLTKTGCNNSVDLCMFGVEKGYIKMGKPES